MKMLLTGPQAITIFPVAKDEAVPQSAKSSSFATPQGYIVAETGNLYLYVKGQEYKFIDAQTQIINDKFCQLELRDQARIIDTQGNLIQDLKGRLSTQEILNAIANKTTTTGTPAA